MTPNFLAVSLAMILVLVTGISVFLNARHRGVNRIFFALALLITIWLGANLATLTARTPGRAVMMIRLASACAALLPILVQLIRRAILDPHRDGMGLMRDSWRWLLCAGTVALLSFHPGFIRDVRLSSPETGSGLAEPVYGGWLSAVYAVNLMGGMLILLVNGIRDIRRLSGIQRAEIGFVIFGSVTALVIGGTFGLVMNLLMGSSRGVPMSNAVAVTTLISILAYGIATHRIMGVGEVLRHALDLLLQGVVLVLAYAGVYYGVWRVLWSAGMDRPGVAHFLATFLVVILARLVQTHMRRVVDLLVGGRIGDVSSAIEDATGALLRVRRLDDLLAEFAGIAGRLLETADARIFLYEEGRYAVRFSLKAEAPTSGLAGGDPLAQLLAGDAQPVTIYELDRARATPQRSAAAARMAELGAQVVAPIGEGGGVPEGLLLLGGRSHGRLYGPAELRHLRLLCGQMAVALSNAHLYTDVQNARSYQTILIENLGSGLIVCDRDGAVTLVNTPAQTLLAAAGRTEAVFRIEHLPGEMAAALRSALAGVRDDTGVEVQLPSGVSGTLHVHLHASPVFGHEQRLIGAMLSVQDVTRLREMERQVQRQDRLASVGTLAAGMAHEIKNPLVSLKTFVQMLPTHYDDPEFRRVFCPLIDGEVKRIDTIVSDLLGFARPATIELKILRMNEVVRRTLHLMELEMKKRDVRLRLETAADPDRVSGDSSLLEQTLINLYLNAFEAMPRGGELRVETRHEARSGTADGAGWIRIRVGDTGRGIDPKFIPNIFDPFFTTKDSGTGLGLSIAYGIVERHGGTIEVESRVGEGTVFSILLPQAGGGAAA
jgi:signal transduction histidine kinase